VLDGSTFRLLVCAALLLDGVSPCWIRSRKLIGALVLTSRGLSRQKAYGSPTVSKFSKLGLKLVATF
jgi:hypothetical protein